MGRFYMTDFEISESYRLAKNQDEQIQILAELNAVARRTMERKLDQLGLIEISERKKRAAEKLDARQVRQLLERGYNDEYICSKLELEPSFVEAQRQAFTPEAQESKSGRPERFTTAWTRQYRLELRGMGRCVWCGKRKEESNRALCTQCLAKSRERAAARRRRNRCVKGGGANGAAENG